MPFPIVSLNPLTAIIWIEVETALIFSSLESDSILSPLSRQNTGKYCNVIEILPKDTRVILMHLKDS